VDLYEAKNMTQVVHHFHALGRATQKLPGFSGPYLGVKESDRHVRPSTVLCNDELIVSQEVQFTEEQLNRGKGELGLLTAGTCIFPDQLLNL
jgi:hypothetical protein